MPKPSRASTFPEDADLLHPLHDALLSDLAAPDAVASLLTTLYGSHEALTAWQLIITPFAPVLGQNDALIGTIDLEVMATRTLACVDCQYLAEHVLTTEAPDTLRRPSVLDPEEESRRLLCASHARLFALERDWQAFERGEPADSSTRLAWRRWEKASNGQPPPAIVPPSEARPADLDVQIAYCDRCTLHRERRCPRHAEVLVSRNEQERRIVYHFATKTRLAIDVRIAPMTISAILRELRRLQHARPQIHIWCVAFAQPHTAIDILLAAGIVVLVPSADGWDIGFRRDVAPFDTLLSLQPEHPRPRVERNEQK